MKSKKTKIYSLRKTKKRVIKLPLTTNKLKKYIGGGISSIGNYYIYSSHNAEVLTSQVRGISGTCIIDEFLFSIGGGSIELDFESVKGHDIIISHSSRIKLNLSELFKHIVDKYYELTKTKTVNPLIVNIDANILGTCNTRKFFDIFHRVITGAFKTPDNKYDDAKCQLRKLPEELNGKITPDTDVTLLKNKILLRWDYIGQDGCEEKKTFLYNPYLDTELKSMPDLYLSSINMVKCKISPSIPITDSNTLKTIGKKLKEKEALDVFVLSRTYPEFKVKKYNYNYDFALQMLVFGINFIELNLNIIDINTCAYNEFFRYDTFVKKPQFITTGEDTTKLNITTTRRHNSVLSSGTNNSNSGYNTSSRAGTPSSTGSSCAFESIREDDELTDEERKNSIDLAKTIRKSLPDIRDVDDAKLESVVSQYIDSCKLNERNAEYVYSLVFNDDESRLNARENFMENNYGPQIKRLPFRTQPTSASADPKTTNISYVGGGGYKYQVSSVLLDKISRYDTYNVSTIDGYKIYSIYNYFDIFGDDTEYYKHYTDADMSIFNILCIKLKINSQKYIACINLSQIDLTDPNVRQSITVKCYGKKDNSYKYDSTKCKAIDPIEINITLEPTSSTV